MNKTKEVNKNFKTTDLVCMAMGAVLITLCAWIKIPATIPFTMQTFAVFFVLAALGGKRGTVSILVYVLLGAVGAPVFAQIASGTGGYIVGFIFMGIIYWSIVSLFGKKLWVEVTAMIIGLIVVYVFGTAWFMFVYTQTNGSISFSTILACCVIPFIIPDLVKLALALILAKRLSPMLKL